MVFRTCGAGAALVLVALLAGCADSKVDLSTDAFVGDWSCNDVDVTLSTREVKIGDTARKVAWIETGGNADYGLFMTDGGHYSVFDTTRRSLTLHDHKGEVTMVCNRA